MSWTRLNYNHKKIKLHLLLMIFLFTVFSFLTWAFLTQPVSEPESPGQEFVAAAIKNMKNSYGFTFLINEETKKYNLKFSGQVVNPNKVIGMLSDYNLKVYRISDDTFIKNPVSEEWEVVEEIEMRDLNSFIQNPAVILQQIFVNWDDPIEITSENINETDYKLLYYLPSLSLRKEILDAFYPNISPDLINYLSCRLWITEDNPYLHKMEFLMTLEIPGEGHQKITREIMVKPVEREINIPLVLKEEI